MPWQTSSSTSSPLLLGDVHDRVHVAGRAPHMHGDDGAGVRADGASRIASGLIVIALVDVDDDRDRADGQHRGGRRHVGVRRHQHLVARADAEADQRRPRARRCRWRQARNR